MAQHQHAQHNHGLWTHDHRFLGAGHEQAEHRARMATLLTAIFMLVEITGGLWFGSMALLADGVHMATHVGALGLAAGAYWLARRNVGNARFSFGSGKFGDLAAFSSAIVLGLIAFGVAVESISRLFFPTAIEYRNALPIAVVGLVVNLASAFILKGHDHAGHDHSHAHDHDHAHDHPHAHDHNMRAAYLHVLADAATSVLAIAALTIGWLLGVRWLDSVVGIVGALVIASWAYGLVRDAGLVLLDAESDPELAGEIRSMIETDMAAQVADLHLWRVGPGHSSLIVSLVSASVVTAEEVKEKLRQRCPELSHVTVEVAVCADCPPPEG